MSKMIYVFVGKMKDLYEDIQCRIETEIDNEIREGFKENGFCDNYGYCSSSCKYYYKCKGAQ